MWAPTRPGLRDAGVTVAYSRLISLQYSRIVHAQQAAFDEHFYLEVTPFIARLILVSANE